MSGIHWVSALLFMVVVIEMVTEAGCGSHGSFQALMVIVAGSKTAAKGSQEFALHSRSNLIVFFLFHSLVRHVDEKGVL